MIDLAFLVSDSKDNTMGLLTNLLHGLQDDPDPKMPYGEISVIGKDFGQKVNQDVESRHGFAAQAGRRKLMAQARNWLLSAALRPYHSWVYWRDADVETCPFTILEDLMRHNKDVIVPNVWRPLPDWLGGEQPYDLNSWQESETALALADTLDEDAVIVEGYAEYATWRPHLAYLRDPYGDPDMEMDLDGVGGVSILAKAKVFRSGVHFPAFSFEKHAETEGFGKMAKRMKFTVTGLPHYTIWHLYEPSVDDIRHMEEMEAERKARENEEKERAERMKKLKEEYKDTNSQWETDKKDIQNIAMKEKEQKHAEKVAEMQKLAGQPAAAQPAKGKVEHTQTKEQLAKNAALKEQATEHKATKPKATEDDEDTEPTKHKATKPEVADDHEDTGGTKLKAAKPKPQVTENDEDTEPTKQKATKPKPKVAEDDEDAEPNEKYSNAKTIPGTESKAKPISEHDSKIKAAAAQDPNVKKEAAEKYAKAKAAPEKEET